MILFSTADLGFVRPYERGDVGIAPYGCRGTGTIPKVQHPAGAEKIGRGIIAGPAGAEVGRGINQISARESKREGVTAPKGGGQGGGESKRRGRLWRQEGLGQSGGESKGGAGYSASRAWVRAVGVSKSREAPKARSSSGVR